MPLVIVDVDDTVVGERSGFVRYGVAPDYLRIDGRWQEHVLYQCLAPA